MNTRPRPDKRLRLAALLSKRDPIYDAEHERQMKRMRARIAEIRELESEHQEQVRRKEML